MDLNYSSASWPSDEAARGCERIFRRSPEKVASYQEPSETIITLAQDSRAEKMDCTGMAGKWGGQDWTCSAISFEEECAYAGTPPLIPFGLKCVVQCCIVSAPQNKSSGFLPGISRRRLLCQGYSEPGSGSDLLR
jgi:alkylation response protein AidB-like acyl-CoA dehydrogenase